MNLKKSLAKFLFIGACLLGLGPFAAKAVPLSPQAQLSLITVSPGAELYSMYGHSAIRLYDPAQGIDYVYNYGTFDFNTPNFYVKFVRGKLPYQLSINYYEQLKEHSIRDNRSVVEQVLNLSPQEKQKVVDLLDENYRPENRSYLYDFFFDNCATRIRDIFQKGVGQPLQFNKTYTHDPMTFRQMVGMYQKPHPWVDLGVDLVMGLPSDATASPSQSMFLPDYLMSQFQQAKLNRGASQQNFVGETRTIFKAKAAPYEPSLRRPTVVFWSMLVVVAALTFFQVKNNETNHIVDIFLFIVTGILGIVIVFLWFGTDHKAFVNNLNVLWAFPLHLPFALLLFRNKKTKLVRTYFLVTAVVAGLLALSWVFFPQEFHRALLPVVLLIALRAWYISRSGLRNKKNYNPYV